MYNLPGYIPKIRVLMLIDVLYSLVNNAGISIEALRPAVLHLTDEDTWDTTLRVNSKSVFLGCKYAITQMLAQEPHSSGDRGWIINISSIMGMIAGPENRKSTRYWTFWSTANLG